MGKQSSKELFEWYAQVALEKLQKIKQEVESFKDCKTREQYSNYMLNMFIAYYGLRCTCDECMDWDFNNASGHYHHCDLFKFCFIVNRCLDWATADNKNKKLSAYTKGSKEGGFAFPPPLLFK